MGAAWLINLNLFSLWAIPVRNSVIAVTITGIVIAGAAFFWRAVLGFFSGRSRKFTDEAVTMEKTELTSEVWPEPGPAPSRPLCPARPLPKP